jgi:transcription elongation factor GreA
MYDQPQFLSKEKYEQLVLELEERKTQTRNIIIERLAFAKSLGDLSENAEYHSSKDEQGKNEARISELEFIIKNAQITEAPQDGIINLGSVVELLRHDTQDIKIFTLVGSQEADILEGKLSIESPLGMELVNKKVSDTVVASSPKGDITYTIKKVS